MPRGWALLLCTYLLGFVPIAFATELFSTLASIGMRGTVGIAELSLHALSAIFCAVAGWMLLVRAPPGPAAAGSAIIVSSIVSIQSLFWTVLPRNVAPGERLPLTAITCGHAVFWLVVLSRYARRERR